MIQINVTPDQVQRAKKLYPFESLKGSITNGKGNIYGEIGEILIYDYFKHRDTIFKSTYDYDLIIDGYKIDVKTKHTTVPPQSNYNCSISAYNTHQDCDYYFFCRVMKDLSIGYLLGYISKQDFYQKATFNKKGEMDGNFAFKDDCYNLAIKQLHPFN